MSTTATATPLRVSTMTVTGHLGAIPDLEALYQGCAFIPYWWVGEGVLKIEFGDRRKGICMEDILHTSTKAKKRFFNQSSLVFRLRLDDTNTKFKETNIKIFKNGGFQMTGVNSEAMARAALTQFIATHRDRGVWPGEEAAKARIAKFDICMMNSDYNVGKAIRRDRLYTILVEEYGLWSNYEPTIYQGVNTKFFWNKTRPATAPPGICVCPSPCEGDGSGYAVGSCKKITISPFRTGSIIITGAKHMEQLLDAHAFINGVLQSHPDVLRDDGPDVTGTEAPRKKTPPPPTTTEGVLRLKMRASPRNVVRLPVH